VEGLQLEELTNSVRARGRTSACGRWMVARPLNSGAHADEGLKTALSSHFPVLTLGCSSDGGLALSCAARSGLRRGMNVTRVSRETLAHDFVRPESTDSRRICKEHPGAGQGHDMVRRDMLRVSGPWPCNFLYANFTV
jgi:hypothetical protein